MRFKYLATCIFLSQTVPVAVSLADSVSELRVERARPPFQAVPAQPWTPRIEYGDFADVSGSAGIHMGHAGVPTYLITGQAWIDFDRDGWIDLFLTDSGGANRLFRNLGDGRFTLDARGDGLALAEIDSGGAVSADYDNDGWPDLYVLNDGPNALFRNQGTDGFVDVGQSAGVADEGTGETGLWADYNGDGLLDLYVTNRSGNPARSVDKLFRNLGNGQFRDESAAFGGSKPERLGFTAAFLDYDNDSDPDLYVVNDKLQGNVMWRNDGPGCIHWCFTDVSDETGTGVRVSGMGIAVGDYDNDGDLDLYFSHDGPAVLLKNLTSQGEARFEDVTAEAGVVHDAVGWGTVFLDFDSDGWLDIYLATEDDETDPGNRLFRNLGDGRFEDVSEASGAANRGPGFGVASADFNLDGAIDLVFGNRGQSYRLLQNRRVNADSGWLRVRLAGDGITINRDAIGARVTLEDTLGRVQMREIKSGSSLGSGNELAAHFGLGASSPANLSVRWPDGCTEQIATPVADTQIEVTYSASRSCQ